jgi:rare lipoprotein A
MRVRTSIIIVFMAIVLLNGCSKRRARQARPPTASSTTQAAIGYTETGIASWYGEPYHGRRAANGEVYDMDQLTAAHRTLAFDTWLRVTNLQNDKHVDVRITDRGPFVDNRILDLSRAAAKQIDLFLAGIGSVRLEVILPPRDQAPVPPKVALQAGAYANEDNAQSQAERIRKFGAAGAFVIYDKQRSLWRVIAGEFRGVGESEGLASRLRSEGVETLVVDIAILQ